MKVVLSCVGKRDPVADDLTEGGIITLVRHVLPQRVILLYTAETPGQDGTREQAEMTAEYLKEINLGVNEVYMYQLKCNPTDVPEIISQLMDQLRNETSQGQDIHVNASSGTPQMQTAWHVLLFAGFFTCKAYTVVAPKHAKGGNNRVKALDFSFLTEVGLLERAKDAINHHRYSHASQLLNELSKTTRNPTRKTMSRRSADWCSLLDMWDKLRYSDAHNGAVEIIKALQHFSLCCHLLPVFKSWHASLGLLCQEDPMGGYHRLYDVYANAQRRFDEGNYVDTVGRVRRVYEGLLYLALDFHGVDAEKPRRSKTAEHSVLTYQGPLDIIQALQLLYLFNPQVKSHMVTKDGDARLDDQAKEIVDLRNKTIVGHGHIQVTKSHAKKALLVGDKLLKGFGEIYKKHWHADVERSAFPTRESLGPLVTFLNTI